MRIRTYQDAKCLIRLYIEAGEDFFLTGGETGYKVVGKDLQTDEVFDLTPVLSCLEFAEIGLNYYMDRLRAQYGELEQITDFIDIAMLEQTAAA